MRPSFIVESGKHFSDATNGERALSDREFTAATALARAYGLNIDQANLSHEASSATPREAILRDTSGKVVKRIALRLFKNEDPRLTSDRDKATAWAQSQGHRVPQAMNEYFALFLIFTGLVAFVVPGVIAIVWLFNKNEAYERDFNSLLTRWIDAGRPQAW
jgi:hypothetical protein